MVLKNQSDVPNDANKPTFTSTTWDQRCEPAEAAPKPRGQPTDENRGESHQKKGAQSLRACLLATQFAKKPELCLFLGPKSELQGNRLRNCNSQNTPKLEFGNPDSDSGLRAVFGNCTRRPSLRPNFDRRPSPARVRHGGSGDSCETAHERRQQLPVL